MRVDEFSMPRLRESHAHNTGAHFTNTGFRREVNLVNDLKEFQDLESICCGNYLTFPFQVSLIYVEPRPKRAT